MRAALPTDEALAALTLPDLRALDRAVRVAIATARAAFPNDFTPLTARSYPMGKIKVTKPLLVDLAAANLSMPRTQVAAVLDEALRIIRLHVDGGGSVPIHGFGTFEPRVRAARTGRNPRTGEAIAIPASTAMGFRPAKRRGA